MFVCEKAIKIKANYYMGNDTECGILNGMIHFFMQLKHLNNAAIVRRAAQKAAGDADTPVECGSPPGNIDVEPSSGPEKQCRRTSR